MTQKKLDKTNQSKISVWSQWDISDAKKSDLGSWHKASASERREKIEFLLYLAKVDPVALVESDPPGDLANLAWWMVKYCIAPLPFESDGNYEGQNLAEMVEKLETWIKSDPKTLGPTIRGVRQLVTAAADGTQIMMPLVEGSVTTFQGKEKGGRRVTFGVPRNAGGLGRGWAQTVCLNVQNLLDTEEGELVRRCNREQCREIFLASRPNQEFCSRKCANAVAFERYKEKQIDEIGEEAYRAQHAKAVRQSQQTRRRKQQVSSPSPRESSRSLKTAPRATLSWRANGTLGDYYDYCTPIEELVETVNKLPVDESSTPLACPTSIPNKAGVRSA
jgi:hypothetical protein